MESSTIRLSFVNDINAIRKKLWETAYSNIETMNSLAKCLYAAFGSLNPSPALRIDFKFQELKFSVDLARPVSNIEMNSILTVAFEDFVDEMHNTDYLDDKSYEICKSRTNMLFSLILNTETRAEVTL